MVVLGLRQVQFGENAPDMLFNGSLGDSEPLGDAAVGPSLGHQGEHLEFAGAQHGERVVAAASRHQLLYQGGIHDRACDAESPVIGSIFLRAYEILG